MNDDGVYDIAESLILCGYFCLTQPTVAIKEVEDPNTIYKRRKTQKRTICMHYFRDFKTIGPMNDRKTSKRTT